MRRLRGNEDGFTLIELMTVMIIIGVLAGMAFPALASQKTKARAAAMKSSLRDAAHAEETLVAGGQSYAPAGAAGLAVLASQGWNETDGVTLTVIDDAMTANGGGYCLRAEAGGADTLYVASSGPHANRITTVPCVAS